MVKLEYGCFQGEEGEPQSVKGYYEPSLGIYILCALSKEPEPKN